MKNNVEESSSSEMSDSERESEVETESEEVIQKKTKGQKMAPQALKTQKVLDRVIVGRSKLPGNLTKKKSYEIWLKFKLPFKS